MPLYYPTSRELPKPPVSRTHIDAGLAPISHSIFPYTRPHSRLQRSSMHQSHLDTLLRYRNRENQGVCISNSYSFVFFFVRHIMLFINLTYGIEDSQRTTCPKNLSNHIVAHATSRYKRGSRDKTKKSFHVIEFRIIHRSLCVERGCDLATAHCCPALSAHDLELCNQWPAMLSSCSLSPSLTTYDVARYVSSRGKVVARRRKTFAALVPCFFSLGFDCRSLVFQRLASPDPSGLNRFSTLQGFNLIYREMHLGILASTFLLAFQAARFVVVCKPLSVALYGLAIADVVLCQSDFSKSSSDGYDGRFVEQLLQV